MSTIAGQSEQAQDSSVRGWIIADTWSSLKRWLRKSLRNPYIVFFTLVQLVVWLLLFTQVFESIAQLPGFESGSYLAFFAPAVVIQIALFAANSSGINLVFDMREGVFNKLLASPTNRTAMFVGKMVADQQGRLVRRHRAQQQETQNRHQGNLLQQMSLSVRFVR